jgi:hypothetical protein
MCGSVTVYICLLSGSALVVLCGKLDDWLYGSLAVSWLCMYGCPGVWISGYLAVRMCIRAHMWIYVYLAVWRPGSVHVWMSDFVAAWRAVRL